MHSMYKMQSSHMVADVGGRIIIRTLPTKRLSEFVGPYNYTPHVSSQRCYYFTSCNKTSLIAGHTNRSDNRSFSVSDNVGL